MSLLKIFLNLNEFIMEKIIWMNEELFRQEFLNEYILAVTGNPLLA